MTSENHAMKLGALLYTDFELLDLYGPLEMFGVLKPKVEIVTVAEKAGYVSSTPGPQTLAEYDFQNCPPLDLLLIPGGVGARKEIEKQAVISFLRERVPSAKITMTVCTGSWILARAGLLDGRQATSNKAYFKLATQQSDRVEWIPEARWVEDGPFFTASGVSAGMDMALAVIASLLGEKTAEKIAAHTEYVWNRNPDHDPFYQYLDSGLAQLET